MRGRHLALVGAVAAACLAAPPAQAAPEPAVIAKALETSTVYVDPALRDSVPATSRRLLVRTLAKLPYPVYVALVPLVPGDRYDGDSSTLIELVHDRLGKPGVYVAFDQVINARDYDGPRGRQDAIYDATEIGQFAPPGSSAEAAIKKLVRFAEALGDPNRHARALAVAADFRRRYPSTPPVGQGSDDSGSPALPIVLGVALAFVLLGGVVAVLRRRRGARPAPAMPVIPTRVFEHAQAARDKDLREDLDARLVAFADTLDRGSTPTAPAAQAAEQRALDSYAAARKLLTGTPRAMDLVAALVLVDGAELAMARAAGRQSPSLPHLCFYDPQHGRASVRVRLRDDFEVPACARCGEGVRTGRTPDALRDGDAPWFEAPTLWARTGLGLWGDDLAGRVLRGESR